MKMQTLKIIGVLFFIVGCGKVQDPQSPGELEHFSEEVSVSSLNETDTASIDPSEIINIGEKIWKIIEDNRAVLNTNSLFGNALPKGAKSAAELDGFSELEKKSYRLHGKNLYGVTVYDVTYSIFHRWGGNYHGKGKYLSNVGIVPVDVQVLWGYTVDVSVESTEPVNVGSNTSPVASMGLILKMRVATPLKAAEVQHVYSFRGDSKEANAR